MFPFKNLESYLDLKNVVFVRKSKLTNECQCIFITIAPTAELISRVQFSIRIYILLCFRSRSGWSENSSVTLCLITVLSYQPVEFSRKTLILQRKEGICLWICSVVSLFNFKSLNMNGKKKRTFHQNMPDIKGFAILNYQKMW